MSAPSSLSINANTAEGCRTMPAAITRWLVGSGLLGLLEGSTCYCGFRHSRSFWGTGTSISKSLNNFPFPFQYLLCHLAFNCRVKKCRIQTWLGEINITQRCWTWGRIEKPERLSPFREHVSACCCSWCWVWDHLLCDWDISRTGRVKWRQAVGAEVCWAVKAWHGVARGSYCLTAVP